MKKLYIIRHAKSDWKSGIKDFNRELNDRGEIESIELGTYLKAKGIIPELIICSAAKRTILTSLNVAKVISYPISKIQKELSIYEAHHEKYLPVVWGINNEINSAFIIGHNPGVSDLVFALTGEYVEFKTSCVAEVSFNITSWDEVQFDTGKLEQFITPNQF